MSDPCQECGRPTFVRVKGSSFSVNRVPADQGYLCEDCAGYECDQCGKQIPVDSEVRCSRGDEILGNYHPECYRIEQHGPAEYGSEVEA